jgi:hypothetical protein
MVRPLIARMLSPRSSPPRRPGCREDLGDAQAAIRRAEGREAEARVLTRREQGLVAARSAM